MATRSGSHQAVWEALIQSGNRNWRKAGNQGMNVLEFRQRADYHDQVPGLTQMMVSSVRMAEEILRQLSV